VNECARSASSVTLNVALAFARACKRVSSTRPRALFAATMLTAEEETIDRHKALGKLLECVATELPSLVIIIILRPLPGVELARLACVHRAFHEALLFLRHQIPGPRYAAPHNGFRVAARRFGHLARAAMYGDLAVVKALTLSAVDKEGISIIQAPSEPRKSLWNHSYLLDGALFWAGNVGHADVVAALLDAGANMYVADGQVFHSACLLGLVDVVEVFIQHGININVSKLQANGRQAPVPATPIMLASRNGHTAVVNLLLQNGATLPAP
jgi:Ankyrin repeat